MNIQSLVCNKDQVIASIVCYNPKLILLSEARTTDDVLNTELHIENYKIVRCDSASRHTGGVVLYVKTDISFSVFKSFVLESNYWCIILKVNFAHGKRLIGCLYHSPSGSHSTFIDDFENLCDSVFCNNSQCILVGDFNLNFLDDTYYCKKIKNLLTSYGINQLIADPTRITNTSSTLIDYVLTNQNGIKATVHSCPKITDHSVISVNFYSPFDHNVNVYKSFRNFNENHLFDIKISLLTCDWSLNSVDVNYLYDEILSNCDVIINNVSPVQQYLSKTNLPWFDKVVDNSIKKRDSAYKIFKNSTGNDREINWNIFKGLRNNVVNLLKSKKKKYFYEQIDRYKNNSKLMWKTLKKLVNGNNTTYINLIKFEFNDQVIVANDSVNIASNFNCYYISSIEEIVLSIRDNDNEWLNVNCNLYHSFTHFKLLSLSELVKIVKSLDNKGSAHEILNSKVLREVVDSIGHVILNFINTSLQVGKFPDKLKTSIIVPVPKVPNTILASEFRPINTLPPIEKVLELAVYYQILDHFNNNQILISNQSGFRQQHSCETALQLTLTKIKYDIDNNKYVLAVFLDLKRAFETIDRDILLKKLQLYGIGGKVLDWFCDYLSGRAQRVSVGDSMSSDRINNFGVPQGSVLGPLLFITYINDIDLYINCEFVNLFADDTLLMCSGQSLAECVNNMNKTLENVDKYLVANKLKINVAKTKAMIFSTKYKCNNIDLNAINLSIANENIQFVTEIKYLGVILDNILSFNRHFEYISNKISKKLYFLSRISNELSLESRITVYTSVVRPHFEYCASILYMFNLNKLSQLQKLQNRGMRIILKCNKYTPITFMLSALQWLSVSNRLFYCAMIFIYKILNNLLPKYFNTYITLNSEIHEHFTRNAGNIYIQRTKYSLTMNSLFYKGIDNFNKLPLELKSSTSLSLFKRGVIEHIKSNMC